MKTFFLCFLLFAALFAPAQKTIVVMGSSTAYGSGATTYDSAWVGRLQHYYRQNTTPGNPDTTIYNLGYPGATTYQEMPDGFVPTVANRPAPNSNINVTKALSYNPDIVIINLPNNDIVNLTNPDPTVHEIMNNFRIMYQAITSAGAKCFITTSQPRNDIDPSTHFYQRQELRDMVDSINVAFGVHAINFWDDLVSTDGLFSLRDDVRDPASQYHLNNTGHRYVFNRVVAKSIFTVDIALPLHLTAFRAQRVANGIQLSWHTEQEEAHTLFDIQRSSDGTSFQSIATQNAHASGSAADYSWTDARPLEGKNLYRLKITEPGRVSYSKVLAVSQPAGLAIDQVYLHAGGLHLELYSHKQQAAVCSILDMKGLVVFKKSIPLSARNNSMDLIVNNLAAGAYLLQIVTDEGSSETRRFTNLK